MPYINLTPHSVDVVRNGEVVLSIPSSGTVARCRVSREVVRVDNIDGIEVPVHRTVFGEVTDLPDCNGRDTFIVSRPVIESLRSRGIPCDDLVSPDEVVRDANGNVKGCMSFSI